MARKASVSLGFPGVRSSPEDEPEKWLGKVKTSKPVPEATGEPPAPFCVEPLAVQRHSGFVCSCPRLPSFEEFHRLDWLSKIKILWPHLFSSDFADHHLEAWDHVIEQVPGQAAQALILCLSRGGAKSTTAEAMTALLGLEGIRRYALYISGNSDAADGHVESIAELLEAETVSYYFPQHAEKAVGKFGNAKGWRRNRLQTAGGFVVDAAGLDTKVRGLKRNSVRPDLMCHEVGTKMRLPGGEWINVEDHAGNMGERKEFGQHVDIWGIPFSETVTDEHRYWTRSIVNPWDRRWTEAKWKHATELDPKRDWIGTPIDRTVQPPQPVAFSVKLDGANRGTDGRVKGTLWGVEYRRAPEMMDPEFWWLCGLWWGDGTLARNSGEAKVVQFVVADTQPEIAGRLKAVASKHGWTMSTPRKGQGCSYYMFQSSWLFQFLETWKLYEPDGSYKSSHKRPPHWVELLPRLFQARLLRGYFDADGCVVANDNRITSVSLEGLLSARRMLARLGIAATIRKGVSPRLQKFPGGHTSLTQQKYDLRWGGGDEVFERPMAPANERYAFSRTFIRDGFIWSKVRGVRLTEAKHSFVPLDVGGDHTYITDFGLSHNCIDDVDESEDSNLIASRRWQRLTTSLLPAGANDGSTLVIGVQNLVHENGVFARLLRHQDGVLMGAKIIGPIPALYDVEYGPDGVPIAGRPSWPAGQPLEVCQRQARLWGARAFRTESQHDFSEREGALWKKSWLTHDSTIRPEDCLRIVIGYDPAVSDDPNGDEHGIVVVGLLPGRRAVVLDDFSGTYTTNGAALRVRMAEEQYGAEVIFEGNQGKDHVKNTLRSAGCVRLRQVTAKGSKKFRALPVAQMYEVSYLQRMDAIRLGNPPPEALIVHSRPFHELETQMVGWVPEEATKSPDRVDALVHALQEVGVIGNSGLVSVTKRVREKLSNVVSNGIQATDPRQAARAAREDAIRSRREQAKARHASRQGSGRR